MIRRERFTERLLVALRSCPTPNIERFGAMFKRARKGTFHKLSAKHLDRYVQECAGRHNLR